MTGAGTTGIFVMGTGNTVRNCEVDGSGGILQLGFGVMGQNNLITGNYVHDLSGMTGDTGTMNTSGGAEAFMVMASNNEISFNSAVNCWGPNSTLGGFEGGCYEIVDGAAKATITNVSFHHNYCESSVGLFEASSGNFSGTDAIQDPANHGKINNITVAYNISVDAMWMYLLQPVNSDFQNVVFANNTNIHTDRSWTLWGRNDSYTMAVTSDAGYTVPADFVTGTVIVRNNIFVDAVTGHSLYAFFSNKMADHSNNLFAPANANVASSFTLDPTENKVNQADLAFTSDYRLTANSLPAIDKGVALGFAEDIDLHPVPCGALPDIGASEYCTGVGGSTGSGGTSSGATSPTGGAGGGSSTPENCACRAAGDPSGSPRTPMALLGLLGAMLLARRRS
jgi:MYXO-CTERM domain-containing protein